MKFSIVKRKNIQFIGFDDTWMMISGVVFLSFIVPWLFLGLSIHNAVHCFQIGWPFAVFNTALFWAGDRQIMLYFRKRFSRYVDDKKRLFYGFGVIGLYTVLLSLLLTYTMSFAPADSGNPYEDASVFLSVASSLFVTMSVCAMYEAIFYLHRWKQSIAASEVLRKEHVTSQLEALKSQVNPHFLFNSLNTLSAIIPEDSERAVAFVQNLSHVYRCILDLKERKEVTLAEELECLERYAFLVKTRFGDNLSLDINIGAEDMKRYVVPLCLQMLTENAIKHNVVSTRYPLYIRYFIENNQLIVSNKIQRKAQEMGNTGTGLMNIRNRYRLTFGCEPLILETNSEFRVELPLIDITNYEGSHH